MPYSLNDDLLPIVLEVREKFYPENTEDNRLKWKDVIMYVNEHYPYMVFKEMEAIQIIAGSGRMG